MIAPFTQARCAAIISTDADASAFGCFIRSVDDLRPHKGLMSVSDKELIVRIQLNQMASVGEQAVQNFRGTFVHRGKELESSLSGTPVRKAGTLVTRLQGALASLLQPQSQEGGVQPQPNAAEKESEKEQAREKEKDKDREEGADPLRSDLKFGASRYSSIHHPRRSICISHDASAEVSQGDATPSAAPEIIEVDVVGPPGLPPVPRKTSASRLIPESGRSSWRKQLGVERAYEDLMDLEQLLFRISECHPLDAEKQVRLKVEQGRLLERLARHLLGRSQPRGADSAGPLESQGSGTLPVIDALVADEILIGLVARRKGRVLLHRVLTCLGQLVASAEKDPVGLAPAELLSMLLVGLLRAAPLGRLLLPEELAAQGPADGSQRKLLQMFTQSVDAAHSTSLAAELLSGLVAGGQVESLCAWSSGAALVRQMLEGCGSGSEPPDGSEVIPDSLIEALCQALPRLYDRALPSGEAAPPGLAPKDGVEEAERLSQDDLWATLISLTEQSSISQKRSIHGLIGSFIQEVNSRAAQA